MLRYQLSNQKETINLFTEQEIKENVYFCKFLPKKEETQNKIFTKINGSGLVNLGSNLIKKRSGVLQLIKIFENDEQYSNFTNTLNFLIKNNNELELIQTDENNNKRYLEILNTQYKEKFSEGSERRIVTVDISFDFRLNYWQSEKIIVSKTLMSPYRVKEITCSNSSYPIYPIFLFTPNDMNVSQIRLYIENELESRLILISSKDFGYYPTDNLVIDSSKSKVFFNGVSDNNLINSDFPKLTRNKNKIYLDFDTNQSVYMQIEYKENFYV